MKLAGSTVYLCGAVEIASNPQNWRDDLSQQLSELGMVSLNPLVKPPWFPNITVDEQRSWKEVIREQYNSLSISHDIWRTSPEVHNIWKNNALLREFCLHLVASANLVILKLDHIPTIGTFFELSLCKYKPVLILVEDPAWSTWLIAEFGISPFELRECFYKDVSSLMSYLRGVDSGEITPFNTMKWMYLTYRCK